jgi:phosphoglycerate dehydrogenase-like enzyme
MRIAVIDDWQGVAADCADWSRVVSAAKVDFLTANYADGDALVAALAPYDAIVALRDRTRFPRELLERLGGLQLIVQTGENTAHIDLDACADLGISVARTPWGDIDRSATPELCFGLMLAMAHRIVAGDAALRAGRWQEGIPLGVPLRGQALGLLGLGTVGARVARYALAFEMEVVAWSPHLTAARAAAAGAVLVDKHELMSRPDILSLHLVASASTYGIVGREDIESMRDGSLLVNTARSALVDQSAMEDALRSGRISAALDVYDREPLPADSWLRHAPNVLITPHLGFVKRDLLEAFYGGAVVQLEAWLDGTAPGASRPSGRTDQVPLD